MKLKHLYRMWWAPSTFTGIAFDPASPEGRYHVTVENGRIEGRLAGTYRGSNHPNRRGDGVFESTIDGVIETDDGATVVFTLAGYSYEVDGSRRGVGWATHWTDADRYRWLNTTLCAMEGEVRGDQMVVDVHEMLWEAPPDLRP